MEMQRILAMQQAFQQRPQNPQISLARQQGQFMGPNYNPGAGIAALRAKFGSMRYSGRRPISQPDGPVSRPPINPTNLPYLLNRERNPQPGGPGTPPPAQPVGQPNPGVAAMRTSFSNRSGGYSDGPYRRPPPYRSFGNINQQIQ